MEIFLKNKRSSGILCGKQKDHSSYADFIRSQAWQ
uniref:Uncharacterized protein n=1 Tax=Rhizophora mucronata TaxID=61149 RepID=A0A2P2QFM2_RHIMU